MPKTELSYEEALAYIHGMYGRGSKFGLARTRELLERLGDPQDQLKFVHIGGTNGKGSTAAMTAAILRAAGYRVGLYISPFVTRFNERIQVNGEEISDADLAKIVSDIQPIAESMEDLPSEFELITALGMLFFLRQRCDIVVLEVGLGGELDSTNIIHTPEVAVITAMGYDHMEILGDTMTKIAEAKAGIIKEGGEVVVYGGNAEADAVFAERCKSCHAKLHVVPQDEIHLLRHTPEGQDFLFGHFGQLHLSLVGSYQTHNAAVVLTVVDVLRSRGYSIPDEAVREGLNNVRWPARFELLHKAPYVIVDGGHNPHGINGTAETLKELFPDQKILFVLGLMKDKDYPTMIRELVPLAQSFCTVTPDFWRALDSAPLCEAVKKEGGLAVDCGGVETGIRRALSYAKETDVVCIVGSLYMAGDARRIVKEIYHAHTGG